MRFSEIYESAQLNELTTTSGDLGADYNLIAYRGRYWKLGEDLTPEEAAEIEEYTGMDEFGYSHSIHDLRGILEPRPDILVARVSENVLYTDNIAMSHNPVTSDLIKKLVKELGIQYSASSTMAADGDDEESRFAGDDFTGKMPTTLFHGTSSKHIRSIAKLGLVPGKVESNWDKIKHPGIIFGAANIGAVTFHANRTAGVEDGTINMDNGIESDFPVVIEFRIPDPSKLIPDYDVAAVFLDTDDSQLRDRYNDMETFHRQSSSGDNIASHTDGKGWKDMGVFGYTGRIPPSHIVAIHSNFFDSAMTVNPAFSGSPKEFFEHWEEIEQEYYGDMEDEDDEDY